MSKQNFKRAAAAFGIVAVAVSAGAGVANAQEAPPKPKVGPYECATAIPLLSDDLLLASAYLSCNGQDQINDDTNVAYQSEFLGLRLPDEKGPVLGVSLLPKAMPEETGAETPSEDGGEKPGEDGSGEDTEDTDDGSDQDESDFPGGDDGSEEDTDDGSGDDGSGDDTDDDGSEEDENDFPGGDDWFPGGDGSDNSGSDEGQSDSDTGSSDGSGQGDGGGGGIDVDVDLARPHDNASTIGTTDQLAHTGSDSSAALMIGGGAMIALGAGAVMYKRRKAAE